MARAGLIRLSEAVFEKDGKQIPYRKAHLTREAEYVDEDTPLELTIRDAAVPVAGKRKGRAPKPGTKAKARVSAKVRQPPAGSGHDAESRAAEMLRAWRLGQAKRKGVPAFRIMSDKVLTAIAEEQPQTAAELLAIPGIGIATVEKYGAQLYQILNKARG